MKQMLTLLLLLSSTLATKTIKANLKNLNHADQVTLGETFKIILESNPTTGFSWRLNYKPTSCESTNPDTFGEFTEPTTGFLGSPGKQTFTFQAKSQGVQELIFIYERPWSHDDAITYRETITVIQP